MIREIALFALLLGLVVGYVEYDRVVCTPGQDDIYHFSASLLNGSGKVNFTSYADTVLLIYNVATYSNVTVQNYNQVNTLAAQFSGEAFEILGFPSSDFGKGEPGTGYNEIMNGIRYVRPGGGFEPTMTFFKSTQINGDKSSDIFTFLKSNCSYVSDTFNDDIYYSPQQVDDVRWNFEKFLIGKDGKVYYRYHSNTYDPADLIPDIQNLLNQ